MGVVRVTEGIALVRWDGWVAGRMSVDQGVTIGPDNGEVVDVAGADLGRLFTSVVRVLQAS